MKSTKYTAVESGQKEGVHRGLVRFFTPVSPRFRKGHSGYQKDGKRDGGWMEDSRPEMLMRRETKGGGGEVGAAKSSSARDLCEKEMLSLW